MSFDRHDLPTNGRTHMTQDPLWLLLVVSSGVANMDLFEQLFFELSKAILSKNAKFWGGVNVPKRIIPLIKLLV